MDPSADGMSSHLIDQVVDLKTQLTECRKRCERQSSDLFEKELKVRAPTNVEDTSVQQFELNEICFFQAEDRIRQLEGRLDAALGGNKNLTQRLQMTTENRSMLQQQLEEAKVGGLANRSILVVCPTTKVLLSATGSGASERMAEGGVANRGAQGREGTAHATDCSVGGNNRSAAGIISLAKQANTTQPLTFH